MKVRGIKETLKEIEEIAEAVGNELKIARYCAEHGFDSARASDYARAAISVLEYETPGAATAAGYRGGNPRAELRKSNARLKQLLETTEKSKYNNSEISRKLEALCSDIDTIGLYGFDLGDLGRDIKKGVEGAKKNVGDWLKEKGSNVLNWAERKGKPVEKAILGYREIINNSGERIRIVGSRKEGIIESRQIAVYLENGSSRGQLYDADGIIIKPSQKFAIGDEKQIYTHGYVKMRDNRFIKVYVEKDKNGILRVSGPWVTYHATQGSDWNWPTD